MKQGVSTKRPILRVLGGVSILHEGAPRLVSPARRQLLALLVAGGPNGLAADHLAEELWSGHPPRRWESSLRMAVSRLRPHLPVDALPQGDGRYRLVLQPHQVDLWLLQQLAEDGSQTFDELRHLDLVRASQPYDDVELSPLLQLSIDRVRSYRSAVFARMVESGEPLSAFVRDELRALATADLLNEPLVLLSAQADSGAGQANWAIRTIEACTTFLRDELDTSPDLTLRNFAAELEKRCPSGDEPARQPFPAALTARLDPPLVGRAALIDEIVAEIIEADGTIKLRTLLITGRSGLGKSKVAATVAQRLHQMGSEIRYGEAVPHSEVAFGQLATMSSELFNGLTKLVASEPDPQLRTAAIWSHVLQSIESLPASRPCVIVVDDAHWLDTQSRDLLQFLTRVTITHPLIIIVIGSDDFDHPPWRALRQHLAASSQVSVREVSPYQASELAQLVGSRFPEKNEELQRQLTTELVDLAGGNPALTETILSSVDPVTLRPQNLATLDPERNLMELVQSLDPHVRAVGSAASILGRSFNLGRLAEVTGYDEAEVLGAIERLCERSLVAELPTADDFRFEHLLIQRAFESIMISSRKRRVHAAAARTADSVHERANHLAAAVPMIAVEEAISALVQSASTLLTEGNCTEAVETMRVANQLAEGELSAEAQVVYATALDLTGAARAAARVRSQAFGVAVAADDWPVAVRAALSGLPAAEHAEGDPERLAMLSRIPLGLLDKERGFTLALALARQNFLVGSHGPASHWADYAAVRASSVAERTLASTTQWLLHRSDPDMRPKERWTTPAPLEEVPEHLRPTVLQTLAVDAIERGEPIQANDYLDQLEQTAVRLKDVVSQWRHHLLLASISYVAGDWEAADRLSTKANELGWGYGVTDAASAFTAQLWFKAWLADQQGDLAPVLAASDEQLFRTDLAQAARASSWAAAGSAEHRLEDCEVLITKCEQFGSSFGVFVPVILIDVALATGDQRMKDRLRELLCPWRGTSPVAGVGVAIGGPIEHHLGRLADPGSELRLDYFSTGIDFADRSGMLAWQIRGRLSLASEDRLLGSAERSSYQAEARELGAGSAFEPLLSTP